MISTWVTSAAVAAVFIAVAVYPWQRLLEHKFLLKKEKRELYRSLLKSFAGVRNALGAKDFEKPRDHARQLEGVAYETELLSAEDVAQTTMSVALHIEHLVEELYKCRKEFNFLESRNEGQAKETRQRMADISHTIGYLHGSLTVLLREDLNETVSFRIRRSKAKQSVVAAIALKIKETDGETE